jgi:hypothetical protein
VDLSLDNGYGAVTLKNNQLLSKVCEKITAVKHCNGKDYWVITHGYGGDAFYAFHVSDTGINKIPVVSHTGRSLSVDYGTMSGTLTA